MSYEHELLVGRIVRTNLFGPRPELISTRDGRIILARTDRHGETVTEFDAPYTAVTKYWSHKCYRAQGGPPIWQVTLVIAGEQSTFSLEAENGADFLKLLDRYAPQAEHVRVRGLRKYLAVWKR